MLLRLLRTRPADADVLFAMRECKWQKGELTQALHFAQRAAAVAPDRADTVGEYGRLLSLTGQHQQAITTLRQAMKLSGGAVQAVVYLAEALLGANRIAEAEAVCRQGLADHGPEARILRRLASAVLEQGRAAEAGAALEQAVAAAPERVDLLSSLAAISHYASPARPHLVRKRAERFGASIAALAGPGRPASQAAPAPHGERLCVGILSPDLVTHSVVFFLEPLLTALAGRPVSLTVYHDRATIDATTERLRTLIERGSTTRGGEHWRWRVVCDLSDAALADAIAADRLDAVVELSGLMEHHRHAALAMLRARTGAAGPAILSWLGYPGTTGMKHVDARLVDALTDPPAADGRPGADAWCTESLERLDGCFVCYGLPHQAGDVQPCPSLSAPGHAVTFGSFNNLMKLSDACVGAWASVLRAVPDSRLLLKAVALGDPAVAEFTRSRFAAHGVDPSRLDLLTWTPSYAAHLDLYRRVDIALDSLPYAGTTTTCEALVMGVPVVTLAPADQPHAHRVGASLLTAAGHPEWIAGDQPAFVERCVALAADQACRVELRQSLRRQVLLSPLCDAPAFADRWLAAITRVLNARDGTAGGRPA